MTTRPDFCDSRFDLRERIGKQVFKTLADRFLPGFVADLILKYAETEDTIVAAVQRYIAKSTTGVVDELGVADARHGWPSPLERAARLSAWRDLW